MDEWKRPSGPHPAYHRGFELQKIDIKSKSVSLEFKTFYSLVLILSSLHTLLAPTKLNCFCPGKPQDVPNAWHISRLQSFPTGSLPVSFIPAFFPNLTSPSFFQSYIFLLLLSLFHYLPPSLFLLLSLSSLSSVLSIPHLPLSLSLSLFLSLICVCLFGCVKS